MSNIKMKFSSSISYIPVVLCLILTGCGGSSDLEIDLAPVSGVVTADGAPLSNVVVTFIPYGDQIGKPSYGTTDESGKYELSFIDGSPGCPHGKFIVTISKFAMPDGSAFPADMPPEIQTAEGMEHIPAQYSSSTQTKLLAEVPESGAEIPFEISLK